MTAQAQTIVASENSIFCVKKKGSSILKTLLIPNYQFDYATAASFFELLTAK
ncbi:MAG: hypothetical protein ACJATE_002348 [Bacteroidia bacterium]|jgi:hypothetical protein